VASLRDLVLCQDAEGARLLERLHAHAEAHDGDVSALEEELAPYWARHELATAAKAEATAWVVRELEARASARRAAAQQLVEAADREERAAARVRAYVVQVMLEAGTKAISGTTCRWSRQSNGGAVPLLVEARVEDLPEHLVRVEIKSVPDRAAIRAALERGEQVAGCRLGERGERVVLR
jgi:hypothetical protein